MEAEHTELGRMADDQTLLNALIKLRDFRTTPAITESFENIVKEYHADQSFKVHWQTKELVAIATQEQINVLQPLIYNDPLLTKTMDANHRFSRLTNGWISPKFKVIFRASPTNNDPELEAVFDSPKNTLDQLTGTSQSLPNRVDRMIFVSQIAQKFNKLMLTKRSYVESELKKIEKWVSS